jgi:AcrR family transcriptional regulator
MSEVEEKARKPRADSQRNRDHLLVTAKAAFAESGADVALEAIARQAGVGIGTLYRHFPTRESLLAAVYRREVDQLAGAVEPLLAAHRPVEALRAWLNLLVDYMATKRVIAPVLSASPGEGQEAYAASGPAILGAMDRLTTAALESGDVRPDLSREDLQRLVFGMTFGYTEPGWADSARRLIDVMMSGLTAGR